jgi:hypothetical protein
MGFYRENMEMLNLLEDAHISSRYLKPFIGQHTVKRPP